MARAKVQCQLLEKELELSQEHLYDERAKYNKLECDVADGWRERYGRNLVQMRTGMEEFEIREHDLRLEIKDMEDELAEHNRSLAVVRHMKDSPDGITEAKIASMAKYERHVYDEMVEAMGHVSMAKSELKVESEKARKAGDVN